MPNLSVDVNSWLRSACYPRRTFYPLSDGPSTRDHRITRSNFRSCSTCKSHSQTGLCSCTPQWVSNPPEPIFERLRYNLGGDRPSQTTRLAVSLPPVTGGRLERQFNQGSISLMPPLPAETRGSQAPTYATQIDPLLMTRVQLRCTGSFRLDAGTRRLHRNHKFAEPLAKTVARSFHHSCRSELTRQGISLP